MKKNDTVDDRRRFRRVKTPILYQSTHFSLQRERIIDIGLGGIRTFTDIKYKVGKKLDIELLLPDKSGIKCTVKVVWIDTLPEGSHSLYEIGLEFLKLTEYKLELLKSIIE